MYINYFKKKPYVFNRRSATCITGCDSISAGTVFARIKGQGYRSPKLSGKQYPTNKKTIAIVLVFCDTNKAKKKKTKLMLTKK